MQAEFVHLRFTCSLLLTLSDFKHMGSSLKFKASLGYRASHFRQPCPALSQHTVQAWGEAAVAPHILWTGPFCSSCAPWTLKVLTPFHRVRRPLPAPPCTYPGQTLGLRWLASASRVPEVSVLCLPTTVFSAMGVSSDALIASDDRK